MFSIVTGFPYVTLIVRSDHLILRTVHDSWRGITSVIHGNRANEAVETATDQIHVRHDITMQHAGAKHGFLRYKMGTAVQGVLERKNCTQLNTILHCKLISSSTHPHHVATD